MSASSNEPMQQSSAAKRAWGSAAKPACDEKRIALDDSAYTEREFQEWYGDHHPTIWRQSVVSQQGTQQASVAVSVAKPDSSQEAYSATANRLAFYNVGLTDSSQHASLRAEIKKLAVSVALCEIGRSPEHKSKMPPGSVLLCEMPTQEASASISVAKPDSSQEALSMPALQCPACKRELCQTRELCWFYRRNVQDAVEVHLMLRPEVPMPQTLVRATEAKQGVAQSWQCGCGTEIADSRAVGPRKAMMTAFKSSKVMLYGQRYTGKKSMWPSIYNTLPFNNIQVRTRDTFHGVP